MTYVSLLTMSYLFIVKSILFLMQVPHVGQNKQSYILKKAVVPINAENYRELMLFGLLSPSPLLQLSSTVEQVIVRSCIIHLSHNSHAVVYAVSCFCYLRI